jgi:DNA-binding protein Fis
MPLMGTNSHTPPSAASVSDHGPILDAGTRLRLGMQLQALYEPVLDEVLDPRLAELMKQLERDQQQAQAA